MPLLSLSIGYHRPQLVLATAQDHTIGCHTQIMWIRPSSETFFLLKLVAYNQTVIWVHSFPIILLKKLSPYRYVTLLARRGMSAARPPAQPAAGPPALRQRYRRRRRTWPRFDPDEPTRWFVLIKSGSSSKITRWLVNVEGHGSK